MAELFASGRIVDLILVLVTVEALALIGLRLWAGVGPPLPPTLLTLGSGAALMLALRAALTGSDWILIAAPLTAALVAHVAYLSVVLRR